MNKLRTVGPRTLHRLADGLESKPYELFELRPLAPTIGAHITGIDMREPLDADTFGELNRALLEWKVLFFRNQEITPEQHLAFARHWGALEVHPALKEGSLPELVRFEKGGTEDITPSTAGYENSWHTDVSWRAVPSLGSILHCIDGPEIGGDTLWADMYAAYDQLTDDLKSEIDGLTATHSFMASFGRMFPPEQQAAMAAKYPDETHPVVRTHPETGRKLLYVNSIFTQLINGRASDASDALLDELLRYPVIPELQVRWNWAPHDVAFWDNRCTQHYACSDYWPKRRVMERATIVGTRPY
jgi:taurine dioxygenase